MAEAGQGPGGGFCSLRSGPMGLIKRFWPLIGDERGISGYISFLYLLLVALFVGSAAQALYGVAAARAEVTRAATAVAQSEAADGCFSERSAKVLQAEIAGGGLKRRDVAVEAANWSSTTYGKTVQVLLGYNYRVRVFGQRTPWWIHLQATAAAPSQFLPGAEPGGVCLGELQTEGVFPGAENGAGREDVEVTADAPPVTGPVPAEEAPSAVPVPAAAIRLEARPAQVTVGGVVYVTGSVEVGGRPETGTAVLLTYPGGERLLFSRDGEFDAQVRLYHSGEAVLSASAGGSPATAIVSVEEAPPVFLAVSLPPVVTEGEPLYLDGEVLEGDGRAALGVGSIAFRCSPEGEPVGGTIPVVEGRFGTVVRFRRPGPHRVVLSSGKLRVERVLTVDAPAPTGIRLTAPERVTAGKAFEVEIRLEGGADEASVRLFSPTDPASVPPASLAITEGSRTVEVRFRAAGLQLLTVETGGFAATASVRVGPGEPAEFRGLRLLPVRPAAGSTLWIEGVLQDRYGNAVRDGTVVVAESDDKREEAKTRGGEFLLSLPVVRAGDGSILLRSDQAEGQIHFTARERRLPPVILTAPPAEALLVDRPFPVAVRLGGSGGKAAWVLLTVYSAGGEESFQARGDANGTAHFSVIPSAAGPLLMSAQAKGYETGYLFRWLKPGRPAAFLGLGAPSGRAGTDLPVTGLLVDRWGDLLNGVVVRAEGAGATASSRSVRGLVRLILRPRQAGLATIRLSAEGVTGVLRVNIAAGPPAAVTGLPAGAKIVAGEPVTLAGKLVDAFGNGVPSSPVRLFLPTGQPWTGTTDAGGRFAISLSPAPTKAGIFPLTVAAGDWQAPVGDLLVMPGEPAQAELKGLSRPFAAGAAVSVAGRVLDRFGNPVADGTGVWLTWPGGGTAPSATEGGAFRLELAFRKAGTRPVTLLAGTERDVIWHGWLMIVPGPPAAFTGLGFQAWTEYGTAVHGFLVTGRLVDAFGNPEAAGSPILVQAPGWAQAKTIYVQEYPYDFWTPGGFDSETCYSWSDGPVILSAGTTRQTVGWL